MIVEFFISNTWKWHYLWQPSSFYYHISSALSFGLIRKLLFKQMKNVIMHFDDYRFAVIKFIIVSFMCNGFDIKLWIGWISSGKLIVNRLENYDMEGFQPQRSLRLVLNLVVLATLICLQSNNHVDSEEIGLDDGKFNYLIMIIKDNIA